MILKDYISILKLGSEMDAGSSTSYASAADLTYISRFKSKDRQMTTLAVRNQAREMLFQQTHIPAKSWEFSVEENNNRLARSIDGHIYHVSFSHCPSLRAVAISSTPVGIDIEEVKPHRPWQRMIDFLDFQEEPPKITNQLQFLRHWTQQEAQIKFRSASKRTITFHHYRPSSNSVLCIASSLGVPVEPEFLTHPDTPDT